MKKKQNTTTPPKPQTWADLKMREEGETENWKKPTLGGKSWEENIGYRVETRKGSLINFFCLVPVSFNSFFIFSMLSLPHISKGSMCSLLLLHSTHYSFPIPLSYPEHFFPCSRLFPFKVLCIMILCTQPQLCFAFTLCWSSLTTYAWQLFITVLHWFYFKMLKKSLRSPQVW